MCAEGFDGGSTATFTLQFRSDTTYYDIITSQTAHFKVTGMSPSTSHIARVCASNKEYPDDKTCSADFEIVTRGVYKF